MTSPLAPFVSKADVRHVLATGEVIKEYPDDTPYPTWQPKTILQWLAYSLQGKEAF